jgi:leucyl aminopeptidase (aminopeptidase T)
VDTIDLDDANVRGRIAQIVEEDQEVRQAEESERRMEQYMDSVTREVQEFAAEEGLDGKTTEKLLEELRVRSENWNAVRKEVGDGNMSWFDARKEFQALREESDAVMNTLLGEEIFTALDTKLWGDHGRGH